MDETKVSEKGKRMKKLKKKDLIEYLDTLVSFSGTDKLQAYNQICGLIWETHDEKINRLTVIIAERDAYINVLKKQMEQKYDLGRVSACLEVLERLIRM